MYRRHDGAVVSTVTSQQKEPRSRTLILTWKGKRWLSVLPVHVLVFFQVLRFLSTVSHDRIYWLYEVAHRCEIECK